MALDYSKMISRAIATGGIAGTIGFAGGAMYGGQKAEEEGAPMSQQFLSTLQGGVTPGAVGFGIGAGGYAVTKALRSVLKK